MSFSLFAEKYTRYAIGGVGEIFKTSTFNWINPKARFLIIQAPGTQDLIVKRVWFRKECARDIFVHPINLQAGYILDPGFVAEIVYALVRSEGLLPHYAVAWPIFRPDRKFFYHAEILMPRGEELPYFNEFALQTARALAKVHSAGLAHGDIKQGNVVNLRECVLIDRNTLHPIIPCRTMATYNLTTPYYEFHHGCPHPPEVYLLMKAKFLGPRRVQEQDLYTCSKLFLYLTQKPRTVDPSYFQEIGIQPPSEIPEIFDTRDPLPIDAEAIDWYMFGLMILNYHRKPRNAHHKQLLLEKPMQLLQLLSFPEFWKDFTRACLLVNPRERKEAVRLYLALLGIQVTQERKARGFPPAVLTPVQATWTEKLIFYVFLEDWFNCPANFLDDLPIGQILRNRYWYLRQEVWGQLWKGESRDLTLRGSELSAIFPDFVFLLSRVISPQDRFLNILNAVFQRLHLPVLPAPADLRARAEEILDEFERRYTLDVSEMREKVQQERGVLLLCTGPTESSGVNTLHEPYEQVFLQLFGIEL